MNQTAELLIDCRCALGEGPIWHPLREELFWFDIIGQTLHSASAMGETRGRWTFEESAAAAGVIDRDTLAVATETGLKRLDLTTGAIETIIEIEADQPLTRANDSRVDPFGGFWIGTMAKSGGDAPGSVYRYYEGRLARILSPVRIPNATCFSPDGRTAYFADTPTEKIMKCAVDPETGMPAGEWELFADVTDQRGAPDGAVVDAEGFLWNARWGGSCVVRHAPDGSVDRTIELPVSQVTCPAFGGPGRKTLYVTSAATGLSAEQLEAEPHAGGVFALALDVAGIAETPVRL